MRIGWMVSAGLPLLLVPAVANAAPVAEAAATCSDYPNQAAAQRAKDTRDADGDGVYCETLPCPCSRPGSGGGGRKRAQVIDARVRSVTDGDTIKVRAYGAKRRYYTVRLIGIDTPEVYGGIECGGRQASRSMRRMAFQDGRGRPVTLTTDPSQDLFDRYGRLLAYVRTSSRQLNVSQVARGWAKVYVYGGKRFRQYRRFTKAQQRARSARRGVWKRCGGKFHRRVASSSASWRRCGNGPDVIYNIRSLGARCPTARKTARVWLRRVYAGRCSRFYCRANRYRCRARKPAYINYVVRCSRGTKRIHWDVHAD